MPYWGSKPADNDYAFGAVGVYIYLIKDRMFKDMATVIAKAHPEQGIVASIQCVRLLSSEFPKCVSVHFGKKELEMAKVGFAEWYEAVKDKIPSEYREAILAEAAREFELYQQQVLK
jgi:hypothetical protein